MAGSIKGIIVEIGGDTSGLQKALRNVNSATSSLTKELRGVNSLLKLDPTDTELVAQKQTILAQNIEETSEKLKILKETQQKADEAIKNGTQISDENYRNLQREIINTENKLKDLQVQASKWTTAGKALEEFGNKVTSISKKIDTLGTTLTTTLTLPVLAIGTAAVTTGNDFEAQMSRVQAIAGATGDELEKLTEQAMQLGAETSFSASEVAQGMENLASAGFTTEEIMEAMPGLLDLAASSGAELATSSEIAASAIRGFGLEASEAGHVADVFAEAAARTNAQTEDMGEAMKYIAPVANTMGLKIEEVAAAIGIMSDAGIKGSQAGTSLRGALTRLTKPTDKMLGVMEDLGISFYDNEGKMKSLTEMISMLQDATKDLTDEQAQNALTVLFGTESLSGMVSLINRGSDDLSDLTKSFEKCDGSASDMADTMLDNTSGSLESLSGSLETAGIAIQKALAPEIKKLAKWIQDLVDDFSDLSEEEQLNILKIVGLVAAIGPAIKILSKLSNGIGTISKGLGTFSQAIAVAANKATSSSSSVNNLSRVISGLTSPVGIAITVIGALAAVIGTQLYLANKKTSESFKSFIDGMVEYNNGIQEAEGYLQRFNDTLFTSTKEQSELEEEMKSIQEGITEISKTASDERRDYTQEEIDQLDEYFTKLNDLQSKMMKIQESQGDTLVQTAEAESDSFEGNYQEYVARSQEWIKTAQDHYSQQKELAEQYRIDSITNLNTMYDEEDRINNEQYNKELERINNEYNTRVTSASEQVQKITEIYSQGMTDRIKNEENMWPLLQDVKARTEAIEQQHADNVSNIKKWTIEDSALQNSLLQGEEMAHEQNLKNIYNEMDKNLSDSQQEQLQTWIQSLMNTEMYGGEIEDENKDIAKAIITTWQGMPKDAKEDMEDTMKGMLEGMESQESTLYSKAASVADNIIGTLEKIFKIGSPSKVMRKMYNFVMQGMELGLEDEENRLYRQAGNIAKNVQQKLTYPTYSNSNLGKLNSNVIDSTRTIFTTPTLNIYTQGEVDIRKIADEVNRIFGSQY